MPLDDAPLTFQAGLLPSNAPRARRVRSAAMALPEALWQVAARVGDVKIDVPDDAVPFLIYELGLEPVTEYVADLRRVLVDGRRWQRIRGTPDSVRMALGWIDAPPHVFDEAADDTWWDLFQLGFDAPLADRRAIERVVGLTRLSKPAHTDVIRLYTHDWNIPAFRLDTHRLDGGAYLDDWSGVWIDPALPKVSFARRNARQLTLSGPTLEVARVEQRESMGRLTVDRGFRVDVHRLDGEELIDPLFALAGRQERDSREAPRISYDGRYPDGLWPDEPYGFALSTADGWGGRFEAWSTEGRSYVTDDASGLVDFGAFASLSEDVRIGCTPASLTPAFNVWAGREVAHLSRIDLSVTTDGPYDDAPWPDAPYGYGPSFWSTGSTHIETTPPE